jgi:signal transduction histidine kinase
MSLFWRIVLALVVAAFVPFVVLGSLLVVDIRQRMRQEWELEHVQVVRDIAQALDGVVLQHLRKARAMSTLPMLQEFLESPELESSELFSRLSPFLASLKMEEPMVNASVAVLDAAGRVLADTRPVPGRDESGLEYYRKVTVLDMPLIHIPRYGATDGDSWIYVAAPIRSNAGRLLGYIRWQLEPALLGQTMLRAVDTPPLNPIFLLDAEDEVLTEWGIGPAWRQEGSRLRCLSAWRAAKAQLSKDFGIDWFTRYTDASGNFYLAAKLAQADWTVHMESPEFLWQRKVRSLYGKSAGLGIFILVLLVLSALFISRHVMRPLERFRLDIRRVGAESLDIPVEKESYPEEVRSLASSFAEMLLVLRENREKLQAHLAELEASEVRNRTLLQAYPDLIFVLDRNGCYLECHTTSDRSGLRLASEHFVGRSIADVLPSDVAAAGLTAIAECHALERPVFFDYDLEIGGELKYYAARIFPYNAAFLVVVQDCTEAKTVERERERLIAEISQRNVLLESTADALSHDLRSPLVNMIGFLQDIDMCIANGESMEVIVEDLRYIKASTAKIRVLQDGMLRYLRMGRQDLQIVPINPGDLVFAIRQAQEHQFRKCSGDLELLPVPPCQADVACLDRILSNLLDNAIKYARPGVPLKIRMAGWRELGMAVYEVMDNGMGIPPFLREKVFQMYSRVHGDMDIPGEGLGLAMIRGMLARMGGDISVQDASWGDGVAFRFRLPAVADQGSVSA